MTCGAHVPGTQAPTGEASLWVARPAASCFGVVAVSSAAVYLIACPLRGNNTQQLDDFLFKDFRSEAKATLSLHAIDFINTRFTIPPRTSADPNAT
ncbi:hypothetical protein SORBI_3004G067850 [Sorghum bicolor]|uniref:Uncharacterized protein n=1 Tax=Sorghum bicolor TaxID=4558 RepID=A0A1Z5RM99_SORBI|nr:hypothetical protein SORBI_3004G067850 [Sorghum bicolor]